jgi:hypothetical protein
MAFGISRKRYHGPGAELTPFKGSALSQRWDFGQATFLLAEMDSFMNSRADGRWRKPGSDPSILYGRQYTSIVLGI